MKFISLEVALYLFKLTIHKFPVWGSASNCYLELLDKLQKRICRAVGPSLTGSLEYLVHRRNLLSLSLIYYFGRCSSELS